MAYEALALITNEGKRRTAEMWATGKAFQVKYFSISAGGHNPSDPTTALAVDPSATTMPGTVKFGPEAIDSIEWASDNCPVFVCTIEQGELYGEVSSVGLYGEIVYPPGDPELGATFLFAVYNRPIVILASTDGPTIFKLTPFM